MFNHEPSNYKCPFCLIIKGIEGDFPYTKQVDIFFKNKLITAFVASHGWPNNKGAVIIIPNKHFENIFDLPENYSQEIHAFSKQVAFALKESYKCDGISTRQHNEPDGGQDVWHYHLHVIPRYKEDNLYVNDNLRALFPAQERASYSAKLRAYFEK